MEFKLLLLKGDYMFIPNYILKLDNNKPILVEKEKIPVNYNKGGYDEAISIFKDTLKLHEEFVEHVWLLLMNSQNEFIGISELSKGEHNSSPTPVKELLITVLLSGATRFFMIHNHPEGTIHFSTDDINMFGKINLALNFISGIEFIDSLIISSNGEWNSYKTENDSKDNDSDSDIDGRSEEYEDDEMMITPYGQLVTPKEWEEIMKTEDDSNLMERTEMMCELNDIW